MEKPVSIEEFKKWHEKQSGICIDQTRINYYDSVTRKMKQEIIDSNFWEGMLSEIKELSDEYLFTTKYEFVSNKEMPELLIKPFESFLDKIYRKNIVNNNNWPDPPDGGWYIIDRSFDRIKDLIRTSFVVKYLDGVELLANRLVQYGTSKGNSVVATLEAREHGYYAAHLDICFEIDIPKLNWDTDTLNCSLELQITTQLQEVIKKLTHTYYETRRLSPVDNGVQRMWQWNYKSEEFTANYLGHILHYLEGMILEVRDRRNSNSEKI